MQSNFSTVAVFLSIQELTSKAGKQYGVIKLRQDERDGYVVYDVITYNKYVIEDLLIKYEGALLFITGTLKIELKNTKYGTVQNVKLFVERAHDISGSSTPITFKPTVNYTEDDIPF